QWVFFTEEEALQKKPGQAVLWIPEPGKKHHAVCGRVKAIDLVRNTADQSLVRDVHGNSLCVLIVEFFLTDDEGTDTYAVVFDKEDYQHLIELTDEEGSRTCSLRISLQLKNQIVYHRFPREEGPCDGRPRPFL